MMKLRFLCANHRSDLEHNVSRAIKFWQTGFDTGQFYTDRLQWADAIPHLGCAFEAAEILLTQNSVDTEVSCQWLTASALLLATSFNGTNYTAEAEDVIWMAINRLEQQLSQDPSQAVWVGRHLSQLYEQLKVCIVLNDPNAKEPHAQINASDRIGQLH
ncbi:MAG: hypothetical protein P8M77_06090 [Porticoccaceae bacterium]|nr:hypothetical protein [Porticoccaceae bacterium]